MSKHSRWSDLDEQCVLAYKRASSGSGSCPPAGGQAAVGVHLFVHICQDKPSDMSCVGLGQCVK